VSTHAAGAAPGVVVRGVVLPEDVVEYIRRSALAVHHGEIRILINVDNPKVIDVITEARERFRA